MQITFLQPVSTLARGYHKGKTYDVPDDEARQFIEHRRAVAVELEEPKPKRAKREDRRP